MAARRSRRDARSGGDAPAAETRLAYSTGGEVEPTQPPEPQPRAGGPVRLRLERRASGRLMTVVTGLPGTPADVAALARDLRTACGTGGTARADAVELQGDQREKAAAALRARGLRVKP